MKFYSTNKKAKLANLKKAVMQGLAEDGGLFMPTKIPTLPGKFFKKIHSLNFQEIAFEVAKTLLKNDIPIKNLKKIVSESINFDAPLVKIINQKNPIYTLELFHGPTLAFKDFGARFMARLMSYFLQNSNKKITILVATSGDTGSAVASGFLNVKNAQVILLYPSGKVSKIQEQQLTTMGTNITALEVKGTFDDCQKLVKQAFTNLGLKTAFEQTHNFLSSANSINIARLIPQSFYYFYAYSQLPKTTQPPIICVPSGNFGNLTAGLIAKKMGLPISKFIAATNANDVFPKYLKTGKFKAKPSTKTISNAMDVGNPSNFARILELYKNNIKKLRKDIWSQSFSDKQTKNAIKKVAKKYNYIMDPHGAVAYIGLTEYLKKHHESRKSPGIFFETAHPSKFADIVEPLIKKPITCPKRLALCLKKQKRTIKLTNNFNDLKSFLLKDLRANWQKP